MPDTIGDQSTPRVGLFVTCLVDAMRPQIGFAAIQLLEEAGCVVEVPEAQTCCGQPAFNSGDTGRAAGLAKQTIAAFENYDYVVVPSGSCAGMIRQHYPEAVAGDKNWVERARNLGDQQLHRDPGRMPAAGRIRASLAGAVIGRHPPWHLPGMWWVAQTADAL